MGRRRSAGAEAAGAEGRSVRGEAAAPRPVRDGSLGPADAADGRRQLQHKRMGSMGAFTAWLLLLLTLKDAFGPTSPELHGFAC